MPGYDWVDFKGKKYIRVGSHIFTLTEFKKATVRNNKYKAFKKKRSTNK